MPGTVFRYEYVSSDTLQFAGYTVDMTYNLVSEYLRRLCSAVCACLRASS